MSVQNDMDGDLSGYFIFKKEAQTQCYPISFLQFRKIKLDGKLTG